MADRSQRQLKVQLRCGRDHVSQVEPAAVRLAHVNGTVVGHSFTCAACNGVVVVPSSVEVLAALNEFGVEQLCLVDERFAPTIVSDDRRLLSMRVLIDDVTDALVGSAGPTPPVPPRRPSQ